MAGGEGLKEGEGSRPAEELGVRAVEGWAGGGLGRKEAPAALGDGGLEDDGGCGERGGVRRLGVAPTSVGGEGP